MSAPPIPNQYAPQREKTPVTIKVSRADRKSGIAARLIGIGLPQLTVLEDAGHERAIGV
jgi:hypothetical protein